MTAACVLAAAAFVTKLVTDYNSGDVAQAIVCVNSHSSDSMWFQQLNNHYRVICHHRPNFAPAAKIEKQTGKPDAGTCFVYLGPNTRKFVYEFSAFGDINPPAIPARISARDFRDYYLPRIWDTHLARQGIPASTHNGNCIA